MNFIASFHVLVFLVLGASSQEENPPLPEISLSYFTGFVELQINNLSSRLTQQFYDEEHYRLDFASGVYNSTTSVVGDAKLRVYYIINRQFNNCTIIPFNSIDSTRLPVHGIVMDSSGRFYPQSLKELLFFNDENLNFIYKGEQMVKDLPVNTWVSNSSFSYVNKLQGMELDFTDTQIEVSFTKPGYHYASLVANSTKPVLVRYSIQAIITDEANYTSNISTVQNFIGYSDLAPRFDVFDVSICSGPSDYQIMIMFIAGHIAGIDLGVMRKNIRGSISNFTGLYPIQIGSIEVVGENGTYIFVKLHISNLTSVAHVNSSVTADNAIRKLLSNSNNGRLPFTIELSPGNSVTPILRYFNKKQSCEPPTTVTLTLMPTASSPSTTSSSIATSVAPSLSTTSQGHLSTHSVIGLAFGMFLAGIISTVIVIISIAVCKSKLKRKQWNDPFARETHLHRDETNYRYFQ